MPKANKRSRRNPDEEVVDRKSAAAGESGEVTDGGQDDYVFDGPFDAEQAVEHLIKLNHEFQEADRRWDVAKSKATEAKNERDNASNAISLLIDRIDRHKNGLEDAQPVLKTIPGSSEGSVN